MTGLWKIKNCFSRPQKIAIRKQAILRWYIHNGAIRRLTNASQRLTFSATYGEQHQAEHRRGTTAKNKPGAKKKTLPASWLGRLNFTHSHGETGRRALPKRLSSTGQHFQDSSTAVRAVQCSVLQCIVLYCTHSVVYCGILY